MSDFERREFIRLSALGFAAIVFQLPAISAQAQVASTAFGRMTPDTPLNWDSFLAELTRLAKSQHDLPWNEAKYVKRVMRLLKQTNFPEFENIKREIEAYENIRPDWFEASSLHYEVDFQVGLFQFEPGEYIGHHDHPDMTGIIKVISGSALTKNYTLEEQLGTMRQREQDGQIWDVHQCILRETENEVIKKGDMSVLTSHESNIHSIMPIEFTQFVDIFTPAYKHDTNAKWYNVDEEGFHEGQKNMYLAEYDVLKA